MLWCVDMQGAAAAVQTPAAPPFSVMTSELASSWRSYFFFLEEETFLAKYTEVYGFVSTAVRRFEGKN